MVSSKRTLFGLIVFLVVCIFAIYSTLRTRTETIEPQSVTLSTGSTKRVADGRAQIWLGEVGTHNDGARLVAAVEFELECSGTNFYGWAVGERPSDEMCGCRVRLVEILDTRPPSATLEISWTDPYTPNLQAASQSSQSGRRMSSPARTKRGR